MFIGVSVFDTPKFAFKGGVILARLCPLFSGSDGNSTYISSQNGAVLVDAGASFKALSTAIINCGGSIEEIKGVFITHEHSDHIKGLKPLINKTKLPVFASEQTLKALINLDAVPKDAILNPIDSETEICNMRVMRFNTSHDCSGSSGYTFTLSDSNKIAVCTDLGVVTDEVRQALYGSKTVLIEANHNIEMLKKGPYPPQLKMRILSDKGHLSNNACASELPNLLKNGAVNIVLGHISKNNNTPLLALSSARASLADIGAKKDVDYTLVAASPTGNEVLFL